MVVTVAWYEAKEKKERKLKEPEEKKERELNNRRVIALDFGIDFHEIGTDQEGKAYDEIVRTVNLLAHRLAMICVKQDKANRSGEKSNSFDNDVYNQKWDWSYMRGKALKICPELIARMPHFSEFEPLKSYQEERIIQKKNQSK